MLKRHFHRLPQSLGIWNRRVSTQVSLGGSQDPASYCKELVRKHDYDSFLCSYFYPRWAQNGYFALKAFNVELAMTQESVSNATIGQMRMQFWKDAVKSIAENRPPRHPIALALHEAKGVAALPPYHFRRIIDARVAELHAPSHLTLDSLVSHAEATSSSVLYLLLSLLSLSSSSLYSHAASHLGIAITISTLLRALPFHLSRRRMVIPAEITAKHGLRDEDAFRMGGDANGMDDAVYEFACVANENLVAAKEMLGERIPQEAMPIFLSGVPVASYLTRLEAANFDAFRPSLQQRDWKLAYRIWRANWKQAL